MNEDLYDPRDDYDLGTCVICQTADVPCFDGRCQECIREEREWTETTREHAQRARRAGIGSAYHPPASLIRPLSNGATAPASCAIATSEPQRGLPSAPSSNTPHQQPHSPREAISAASTTHPASDLFPDREALAQHLDAIRDSLSIGLVIAAPELARQTPARAEFHAAFDRLSLLIAGLRTSGAVA